MKRLGRIIIVIMVAILIFVGYVIFDNNRIKIVEQTILIDNLPKQLEGFRILQVSDLHEKEFGKKQSRLIDKINLIDYDVLLFTGDMLDGIDSTNYDAFYSVIEGLKRNKKMYYVSGNTDPYSYVVEPSFAKSEFVKGMEERGVALLESVESIEEEGATIHFVEFELSIIKRPEFVMETEGIVRPIYNMDNNYINYQKELWEDMKVLEQESDNDVIIAVNHYPVVDNRIDYIKDESIHIWRNYDLIVAGHYHGGQIRLPFLGALFIPESWYNSGGLFPPNDRVKGLWEYDGTKQYVSAGLGSSDAVSFLKFRLFNPPEINVLILRGN